MYLRRTFDARDKGGQAERERDRDTTPAVESAKVSSGRNYRVFPATGRHATGGQMCAGRYFQHDHSESLYNVTLWSCTSRNTAGNALRIDRAGVQSVLLTSIGAIQPTLCNEQASERASAHATLRTDAPLTHIIRDSHRGLKIKPRIYGEGEECRVRTEKNIL